MDLAGGACSLECCRLTVQVIWGPEGRAWGPGHIHCIFHLYLFLSYVAKASEIHMNFSVFFRLFPVWVCVSISSLPPAIYQARVELVLPAEAKEWVFK